MHDAAANVCIKRLRVPSERQETVFPVEELAKR
jgi:hypothetical protein